MLVLAHVPDVYLNRVVGLYRTIILSVIFSMDLPQLSGSTCVLYKYWILSYGKTPIMIPWSLVSDANLSLLNAS